MLYIVAFSHPHRIGEVSAYLYGGQNIITEPKDAEFGAKYVIIESPQDRRATDLADRLNSGNIGARVYDSFADAVASRTGR